MAIKKYSSFQERTKSIRRRLSKQLSDPDQIQSELLDRLAHQLAQCEEAELEIEESGVLLTTRLGEKRQNPAINVAYNANATALRIINQLNLSEKKEEIFGELDF